MSIYILTIEKRFYYFIYNICLQGEQYSDWGRNQQIQANPA